MSRSKLREKAFQLLFRAEFVSREELGEQAQLFFADEEQQMLSEKEQKQILEKVEQIVDRMSAIDGQIDEKTVGWKVNRLGKVELAILRLAVYEILYDDAIPVSVSINEAVELAKKFAAGDSPAFINGVLAKFAPKEEKSPKEEK